MIDPSRILVFVTLIFFAFDQLIVKGSECIVGHGHPDGVIPQGRLPMGSEVRIRTNSTELTSPKFDSNGKVSGRLEVKWPIEVTFYMGVGIMETWTSINEYSDGWGAKEAKVACHMLASELNYYVVDYEALSHHDTPDSDYERVYITDVACDGDEPKLFECPQWTPHPNSHVYDEHRNIGISCTFRELRDTSTCEACVPGKFQKLVDSMPICEDCEPGKIASATEKSFCSFCSSGEIAPLPGSTSCTTCPETQVALPDRMSCGCPLGTGLFYPTGQLKATKFNEIRLNLGNDTGVIEPPTLNSQGIVEGRLELNVSGVWGTVRASTDYTYPFGETEALTACRHVGNELGYVTLSGEFWTIPPDLVLNQGAIECVADDLDCDGTEASLNECKTSTSLECGRKKNLWDVGVRCQFAEPECNPCEQGYYSSDITLGVCLKCPKDSFGKTSGAVICDRCPFGQDSAEGAMAESRCFSSSMLWSDLYVLLRSDYGDDGEVVDGIVNNGTIRMYDGEKSSPLFNTTSNLIQKPHAMTFLDPTNFLLVDYAYQNHEIYQYDVNGEHMTNITSMPAKVLDILYLAEINLIAVSCMDKNIYFFDRLKGYKEDEAHMNVSLPRFPTSMARGKDNTILVSTLNDNMAGPSPVYKICVPGNSCDFGNSTVLVNKGKYVTIDLDEDYFFVGGRDSTHSKVYRCPLSVSNGNTEDACEILISLSVLTYTFDHLQIDSSKKLLYVLIGSLNQIYVYDYSVPLPLFPSADPTNIVQQLVYPDLASFEQMTKIYFKPSFTVATSTVDVHLRNATAGEPISLPLVLKDQFQNVIASGKDIRSIRKGLVVKADGKVPTQIEGSEGDVVWLGDTIVTNSSSRGVYDLDAVLQLTIATMWNVSVMGMNADGELQHFSGSPSTVYTAAADASPEHIESKNVPRTITAGEYLVADFATYDRFGNPTKRHINEDLIGKIERTDISQVGDEVEVLPSQLMEYSTEKRTYQNRHNITAAGEYELKVNYLFVGYEDGVEIGGSPYRFTVVPTQIELSKTIGEVNGSPIIPGVNPEQDSSKDRNGKWKPVRLKLVPRDKYGNFIPNLEGYKAIVRWDAKEDKPFDEEEILSGPLYEFEYFYDWEGSDSDTEILVGFKDPNGAWLDPSYPVTVDVKRISGGVSSEIISMISIVGSLSIVAMLIGFREIMKKRISDLTNDFGKEKVKMQKDMAVLHECLKKKQHTDAEMEVMMRALEDLKKDREDELRSVLVSSKQVNIISMLGQGAFGQVHLAVYRANVKDEPFTQLDQILEAVELVGCPCILRHANSDDGMGVRVIQSKEEVHYKVDEIDTEMGRENAESCIFVERDVAVKQLLSIDDESVGRFRFECFLTKELRHPNIVQLVGVCWDSEMLGCLLEYVDGGSLEDRLRKDWNLPREEKMTWKVELLKFAVEIALGVQFLHDSRYFDPKENCWRQCIIHRDLKPDNMLVTKDNVLKLTDFGEARAQVNTTMTAVGTPLYIAPEIMRNDHYDHRADTFSFGIVLIALIRTHNTAIEFFFERLQKHLRKKSRMGIGVATLNRHLEEGWRPKLPIEFYPKMSRLIERCIDKDYHKRPDFNKIVSEITGDISLEIQTEEEPIIGSGVVMKEDFIIQKVQSARNHESARKQSGYLNDGEIDHIDNTDVVSGNTERVPEDLTRKLRDLQVENEKLKFEVENLTGRRQVGKGGEEEGKLSTTLAEISGSKDGGEIRKEEPAIVTLPGMANESEDEGGEDEKLLSTTQGENGVDAKEEKTAEDYGEL
mmetsp:Transcript_13232/g.26998  ORF Transcript_13232/g.26998 Transcript_13232/m.26998 type:complete len:1771 (+) Transcript_13232:118-5430(+)